MSLEEWLLANGLGKHIKLFLDNEIDLDVLPMFSDRDFENLGLPVGARKRLRHALDRHEESLVVQPAHPVSGPQAERRQLTVMFCDLVGSTRLSQELDPEELRKLIRQYQDACAGAVVRYEGHVAQFLGDGVLVYFGYPKAHEGEAERAIKAALDIVRSVGALSSDRDLQVRIGIDTGLVVIGQGDALAEQERTAVGDAPNVAARLQGLAQPNSIVISDRTRRIAGEAFNYIELGLHELKGISEPLVLWEVSGEKSVETRFDAATGGNAAPMVGREMELDVARQAWERARKGRLQVLSLCGEPGIGKSRLVRAVREQIFEEGAESWQFQCSPFFLNSALHPFVANVQRTLSFESETSLRRRFDALSRMLKERFQSPDTDVNLIARLLNLPVDDKYGDLVMSPEKQKAETIRALVDLVERACQEKTLLLLFEDLHWADPTTLEAIGQIMRRKKVRALIVLTYRPEFRPSWISEPNVTSLTLGRLDAEQISKVAVSVAHGKALPDEIVNDIVLKTDGVPLFVEELTRAVIESNLLEDKGEHYVLKGILAPLAIPTTLHDSLMARLDRFSSAKRVAQIGACIGREFSYKLLLAVAASAPVSLDKALAKLIESELVQRSGQGDDAKFVFKHALIQDAAHESLLRSTRAQLHGQIASALEKHFPEYAEGQPEVLAQHFGEAGQYLRAVDLWLKAGSSAIEKGEHAEATANLRNGLSMLQHLPEGSERNSKELLLQINLGTALGSWKGYPSDETGEAFEGARQLSEFTSDDPSKAAIYFGLWVYYLQRADYDGSRVMAENIARLSAVGSEPKVEILARQCVGCTGFFTGDIEFALAQTREGCSLYEKEGVVSLGLDYGLDPGIMCYDWSAWALWMLGFPEKASRLYETGLKYAFQHNHLFTVASTKAHLAVFDAVFLEAAHAAESSANEAIVFCQRHGVWMREVQAEIVKGWAISETSDAEGGAQQVKKAIESWVEIGAQIFNSGWYLLLAKACMRAKQWGDARGAMEKAFDAAESNAEGTLLAELYRCRGDLVLQSGAEHDDAEEQYKKAIEIARMQKTRMWELRSAMSYARLMQSQGRTKEATELLKPVYDWFTEGFDTKDLVEAKALLEELGTSKKKKRTGRQG